MFTLHKIFILNLTQTQQLDRLRTNLQFLCDLLP